MVPMTRVFDDIAQVSESRQGAVIRVDFIQKYAEGREDSSERYDHDYLLPDFPIITKHHQKKNARYE